MGIPKGSSPAFPKFLGVFFPGEYPALEFLEFSSFPAHPGNFLVKIHGNPWKSMENDPARPLSQGSPAGIPIPSRSSSRGGDPKVWNSNWNFGAWESESLDFLGKKRRKDGEEKGKSGNKRWKKLREKMGGGRRKNWE